MIVTNSPKIYKKLCLLRDHGMTIEKKYYHKCLAFNYRMTSLQAAIGIGQLMRINEILKEKKQIKKIYEKYLIPNRYKIFSSNGIYEGVNWFVTLTFEKRGLRDSFIAYMNKNKVECRQMVFPVTFSKHFECKNSKTEFKNSYKVSLNSVHLPSSNDLTRKKIINICRIINAWSKL